MVQSDLDFALKRNEVLRRFRKLNFLQSEANPQKLQKLCASKILRYTVFQKRGAFKYLFKIRAMQHTDDWGNYNHGVKKYTSASTQSSKPSLLKPCMHAQFTHASINISTSVYIIILQKTTRIAS